MTSFKTYCPCCRKIIDFNKEYLLMNKIRDAIFFECNECKAIFFTDTFGGSPIAYYDNEKIVDLRNAGYDENDMYIL